MQNSPPAQRLFLDFDGVLCDSLEECFRSSWLAGESIRVTKARPPEPPFDDDYRARFLACRPFVRSGEDYLMVHCWVTQGRVPASQQEFDQSLIEAGKDQLEAWKKALYDVREALLEHHRKLWLSWNPLYSGIAEALGVQIGNPNVWILSTKKAEFIIEILGFHGVAWPRERTVYTGSRKKLDLIGELAPGIRSQLIDDQVDHLDFDHPLCDCALAAWGYVAPGSVNAARATLSLGAAVETIRSFPFPRVG